jgi:isochorismate synthase
VRDALDAIPLSGDEGPGGSGVLAMGALPFSPDEPATLVIPATLVAWRPGSAEAWVTTVASPHDVATDGALSLDESGLSPLAVLDDLDDQQGGADYVAAVRRCVAKLAGGIDKVVLARAVHGTAAAVDAAALARSMQSLEPTCTVYSAPWREARFVGASPELVVSTADGAVSAHPLAGTVALDGSNDQSQIDWIASSTKNLVEHASVVDDIVTRLTPLCDDVTAPDRPDVVVLGTIAHLGTWVDGKLAGPRDASTAMRALAAIHPTPAVGGVPRDEAMAVIAELESAPRGVWAGAVGWVDADGSSSWTLGIRGVLLDGDHVEVWAGAGIVADSRPDEELEETTVKLRSVLRAFDR